MPSFDILKQSQTKDSFRVESIKGQFDIQTTDIKERFQGHIDFENFEWNIGLIYGASGSGKSTIAKQLFPNDYIKEFEYSNRSVIDDMPENLSPSEITRVFNSVGFATVWSWLKPYHVLSTGEKMRVDLSRAILENRDLIVFDEYTSVVNREVAKHGSYALQKAVRKSGKKFIAVGCHSDVIDWLQPDWTFNTDKMLFKKTRGLLRRPKIEIDIFKVSTSFWPIFKKYHYMNSEINEAAHCYMGVINNEPVCFFAVLHFPHPKVKNMKRGHRLVVLPDYQGLGIGHEFSSQIAEYYTKQKFRFRITSSTKSLFKQRARDPRWAVVDKSRKSSTSKTGVLHNDKTVGSQNKYTYSYEYIN